MRWLPFAVGCVMATIWWSVCHACHLSTYTTVSTTLLFGLAAEALFLIPPRNMDNE